MKYPEIKSLTGVRGLAAMYVVIYHWFDVLILPKNIKLINSSLLNNLNNDFLGHGYLCVDIFFVLSGFVLSLSSSKLFANGITKQNYFIFMYKRFSRIFPLYICITLLYYILFKNGTVLQLLVNFTLLQGILPPLNGSIIPPGWSLTNEWIIYFLFPFIIFYALKIKNSNWILVAISVSFLLIISFYRNRYMNWGNFNAVKDVSGFFPKISYTRGPASFLRALAAYFLGIYSYLLYERKSKVPYSQALIFISFLLLFYKTSDLIFIILIPVLIVYITKTNCLSRLLSSKPIYFSGLISYSVYVNHFIFILSSNSVLNKLEVNNNMFSVMYVTLGTLILSTITYYAIEKPGILFFQKSYIHFFG